MSIYCRYSLIVMLQDKAMLSLTPFIETYLIIIMQKFRNVHNIIIIIIIWVMGKYSEKHLR